MPIHLHAHMNSHVPLHGTFHVHFLIEKVKCCLYKSILTSCWIQARGTVLQMFLEEEAEGLHPSRYSSFPRHTTMSSSTHFHRERLVFSFLANFGFLRAILASVCSYPHSCHCSPWTHGTLSKVLLSISDLLHSEANHQSQETIYRMGKKYFQTVCLTRVWYPEEIRKPQNPISEPFKWSD